MATPPKTPTDTDPTAPETQAAAPASAAPTPAKTTRKPAARKPAATAPKPAAETATKAPAPRKPAKPRTNTSTRVAANKSAAPRKPAATRTPTPRLSAAQKAVARLPLALPKGRWGVAAIVGSIAAVGAAVTGALFALRGSTPKVEALNPGETAHQADGTDSSASFEAGIADEGTIPN